MTRILLNKTGKIGNPPLEIVKPFWIGQPELAGLDTEQIEDAEKENPESQIAPEIESPSENEDNQVAEQNNEKERNTIGETATAVEESTIGIKQE